MCCPDRKPWETLLVGGCERFRALIQPMYQARGHLNVPYHLPGDALVAFLIVNTLGCPQRQQQTHRHRSVKKSGQSPTSGPTRKQAWASVHLVLAFLGQFTGEEARVVKLSIHDWARREGLGMPQSDNSLVSSCQRPAP